MLAVWELLCRSAPYAGLTQGEIIFRKVNLNEHDVLPLWLPEPVADLARSCWEHVSVDGVHAIVGYF